MTLQEIAWIASGLSLIVATATFIFSTKDRIKRERREEVLKWQRTIIYSILQQGASTFNDIKSHYLQAAQQAADLEVPKTEIQDDALKLVLLSLLEGKLISLTSEGKYVLNVEDETKKELDALAYSLTLAQVIEPKAMSKVFELVETQPGIYTIDSLHRHLKENDIDIEFARFNLAIRGCIAQKLLYMNDDQKLGTKPRIAIVEGD